MDRLVGFVLPDAVEINVEEVGRIEWAASRFWVELRAENGSSFVNNS